MGEQIICDNMSSYLAIMEGTMDAETSTLTMRWRAPDMTGQMTQHRYDAVMSADRYFSTFYMGEGDEAVKSMVIDLNKKKTKGSKTGSKAGR